MVISELTRNKYIYCPICYKMQWELIHIKLFECLFTGFQFLIFIENSFTAEGSIE